MKLTGEQLSIVRYLSKGNSSLLVEALAGTGKTSTLLAALPGLPQQSILIAAFNKKIAEEIEGKLQTGPIFDLMPRGKAIHVKTFHALGLRILKHHYPQLEVNANATEELISACAGQRSSWAATRTAVRLVRTAKEAAFWGVDTDRTVRTDIMETLERVGEEYELFGKMKDTDIERTIWLAGEAIRRSADVDRLTMIDFCDMVWLPVVLNLAPPSRYHAVLVDELQDISYMQFELVRRLKTPRGRFVGIGDPHQQIFQFRGSMGSMAWSSARNWVTCDTFKLTTSFRCSKAVIAEAQHIVPEIKAGPDAPDGSVSEMPLYDMPAQIAQGYSPDTHTFVLSRTNAALLDVALYLWQHRVKFQLNAGQEMLDPIFGLLDFKLNLSSEAALKTSLEDWRNAEMAKAVRLHAPARYERIDDQCQMLEAALRYTVPTKIKGLLQDILQDNKTGVLLSTVHKVKGLEADRVFLLQQTFLRDALEAVEHPLPVVDDEEEHNIAYVALPVVDDEEEHNIAYVAITRAREHLTWVDLNRRERPDEREFTDEELAAMDLGALDRSYVEIERQALTAINENADNADELANYAERIHGVLKRRRAVI